MTRGEVAGYLGGAGETGEEGKCKAIGLSDISLEKVKEIFEAATIKPAVVHVESHPYLPEWELLDYCRKNGIVLQAFAALGHSSEHVLADRSSPISPSGLAKLRLKSRSHGRSSAGRRS